MKEMCLECSGSGAIDCEHCGGTGGERDSGLLNEACRHCAGTGRVSCPHCQGTGQVEAGATHKA